METLHIKKINEVYMKVTGEKSTLKEISNYFTFKVPNYQHTPQYKFGGWNGDIHLFDMKKSRLYTGLYKNLLKYCDSNNISVTSEKGFEPESFSAEEAMDFFKSLNTIFKPKIHQIKAFLSAVRKKRVLILSPTASGKSFIIYLLSQYFANSKFLIIVPTVNLVNQMKSDLIEYDLDCLIADEIHQIMSGKEKSNKSRIIISTWHSLTKLPKSWFNDIDIIVGDEAHKFKANELKKIMHKMETTEYRIGMTGTLDDCQTNIMVLNGLFGEIIEVAKTHELMEKQQLANLKIYAITLSYPTETRKLLKKAKYPNEINFLFNHEGRNKYIRNLATSLKGNTLVLFSRIDHGKLLHKSISEKTEHETYLIYGSVDGDERERIRKIVNEHENSITVASMGTFSTGVNIPNLNNIIFAAPTKAKIIVMQSIGRGLRTSEIKSEMALYDISDDLSYASWINYTLRHYHKRIGMYANEKFKFKKYNVEIK